MNAHQSWRHVQYFCQPHFALIYNAMSMLWLISKLQLKSEVKITIVLHANACIISSYKYWKRSSAARDVTEQQQHQTQSAVPIIFLAIKWEQEKSGYNNEISHWVGVTMRCAVLVEGHEPAGLSRIIRFATVCLYFSLVCVNTPWLRLTWLQG